MVAHEIGLAADSPEGIPSNILASRLKHLESAGLVTRSAYSDRPARYRYELTEKGRDLLPVLDAMLKWSRRYVPGVEVFPKILGKG